MCVLGLLRARRGDPGAWDVLDEARDLALGTGESQRIGPVASARAEALWLEGREERIDEETARALELILEGADAWEAGALAVWRWRAGLTNGLPQELSAPAQATIAGDHEAAARAWEERGCRYDAALARADSGDEQALRLAHDAFVELDAAPAAALVARRLRELGARGLPRGPRRTTRANPAGLTARQTEILTLVAAGLRNAEIAARLHVTSKTVEHHVSAILQKLGARTRAEAGVQAVSLGLVAPKMGGPPDAGAPVDP
jgi:DNA-binding CsgD family transcriptional regulator